MESATRTITVLFGDIRDFTSITREVPPERVVQMLNEYHSVMVERIFGSGARSTSSWVTASWRISTRRSTSRITPNARFGARRP